MPTSLHNLGHFIGNNILLHIKGASDVVTKMLFPLTDSLTIRRLRQEVADDFPNVLSFNVFDKGKKHVDILVRCQHLLHFMNSISIGTR